MEWASVYVCVWCVFFFRGGRAVRRKEKLAWENKVNEAWRRLPSPVFGRGSRASSFTVTTTPGGRAENDSLEGGGLVEEPWGCNRILSVYLVWLWLLTEATLDNTGLQSSGRMFEQTLTCRMHLHFPKSNWISLDWKRPLGWGVKRACCTQHNNAKVGSYYNHNDLFCALTDYHWGRGK